MTIRAPILVVDDNPANLKVARFALESEGYQVRTAADGEEALHILRDFRPRLILMDIQLPGVDGLELTRSLKADPGTRDIIIVAVTAYAMKGDRERALRAGCDGYITKPVDPILLPVQIAEHLGRSRGEQSVVAPVDGRPAPALATPSLGSPKGASPNESSSINAAARKSAGTILVVEDNPTTRKMFRLALETAGYEVIEAADCKTALGWLEQRQPDLIIQDLILPDMDGLELARSIRKQLGDVPIPIVCVSGFLSRLDEARALKGGFVQVLVKPVDPFQLLDVVKLHLASPPAFAEALGEGRLLLAVDDDPLQRKFAQVWFSSAGFNVLVASDGEEGLDLARRKRPAVIVSDVLMPKMDGFAFCLAVRRAPELAAIPVILNSSAYVEKADQELAARVGASALVCKTDGLEAVVRAVSAALTDPPPVAPNEPLELLESQHSRRALWQLERQVQQNARLLQRSTLQEAQLAVLAGVAEALAKNKVVNGVLGDVLAACLDMAGISKGALYLMEGEQQLVLKHQIGFSGPETLRLRASFGYADFFTDVARLKRVVLIPSAAVTTDVAQRLIVDAGVTSLLLVPVTWGDVVYGTMLLGARTADITGEDALAFARVLGAQMGQAISLARAFASLGASELRYRTLTDNANDAICILTPDGVIREVNRRFAEILGYSAEHCVNRHVGDFAAPGRREEIVERFRTTVTEGGGPARHYEIQKRSGEIALLEFSSAAVDVDGEALVLAIGREVTEQVQARAQLMVSDRMASVGSLAAGVAHEINNPLAAVFANLEFAVRDTELLASELGPSPRLTALQESLREGLDASERVCQIVRDLKIFSRAEEDRRGPVDTRRVLESTLRMAWNEIRHRACLVKAYGDVPCVDANEARLGQVFLNLVVNAAQALPEGHADTNEIKVTTSVDSSGRVVVEVRDTGPGIPADTLKNLFTPFFTTKPAGVGTGLGLVICQRILAGIGGAITVESQVGVGTAFKVFLAPARGDAVEVVAVGLAAPAVRRGRVLLIDDDHMIGSAIRRMLGREHDVEVLASAQEALGCIRAGQRFDVVLCDVMMPVMTGMDFYDKLVESAGEQAERVVFLTAGAFTARAREFLERVPNGHLEKPFELQDLRALVNERVR
jgi:PAS domain S-box-containing protein